MTASQKQLTITVDYGDPYVEPLILNALRKCLPSSNITFNDASTPLSTTTSTLQWRSYETLDFMHALSHHSPQTPHLINAYVIRKALIRKHYLAHTILSHVTKHPSSILKTAFPTTVDFELDYAEFLDEALVEAFELRESFDANEGKEPSEWEWWILKPSMSDRGQGIRLFSSEDELRAIFEAWEAEMPDSDEDEDGDGEQADGEDSANVDSKPAEGIMTSHLRHFIAQRYIDRPLLIPDAPFLNRKFHIRTYVVAAGALKVYVYSEMLALFASKTYTRPSISASVEAEGESLLEYLQNVHLTNTCVQSANGERNIQDDSVFLLSKLPLTAAQQASIHSQICSITSEMFSAALAHPTNFQPLPQAFELFGVDFLCSRDGDSGVTVHLLEVNAFPDFAQTGDELKVTVVQGLFEETTRRIISPQLWGSTADAQEAVNITDAKTGQHERLELVLNVDAGRH